MDGSVRKNIFRITPESSAEAEDDVAVEKKLSLSINGRHFVSLYCTPTMIKELVAGFLLTEGILSGLCPENISISRGDEISVRVKADGAIGADSGAVTSGCGGGLAFQKKPARKAADFYIHKETLMSLFMEFQGRSELHRLTGCVHSAALASAGGIEIFAEDIGRHNAVDKVIGRSVLEGSGFEDRAMFVSGRLSSEMLYKCSRWGIPVVASRTAPTDLALRIAGENGVTVVGFLRGRRMNVYTRPDRIK